MALNIKIKAPDFKALTDEGIEFKLSSLKGKWVVLYFYPKDNTSGCTVEACDFRDNMARITKAGAVVIGVSPDSVKSHDGFKSKFNLNFALVSDTDKEICKSYDVMGEKSLYGRKFVGVIRTTYIIDPQGIIGYVDPKVSVNGHVDAILNKLKELKSN
ncbi:MAG: peroxiredoxin [Ignavibacteriae bacterium]|nr:peroxiredoxin [Ignavibacteriota bacterium]